MSIKILNKLVFFSIAPLNMLNQLVLFQLDHVYNLHVLYLLICLLIDMYFDVCNKYDMQYLNVRYIRVVIFNLVNYH